MRCCVDMPCARSAREVLNSRHSGRFLPYTPVTDRAAGSRSRSDVSSRTATGGESMKIILTPCLVLAALVLAATAAPPAASAHQGVVLSETNDPGANAVAVFLRLADGNLVKLYDAPTGGLGTGGGLGSQGALAQSDDGRFLFAVNAGSNSISAFRVFFDLVLVLVDVVPSGGTMPTSITTHGDLLYVLNAGAPNNVTGFTIGRLGTLSPLEGSTRALSADGTMPAQVEFNPTGRFVVVTERMTNLIDVFRVHRDGRLHNPIFQPSAGQTPYRVGFRNGGQFIVSEAFGGQVDASALSSYELEADGDLRVISASVPTTETAACWVVVTDDRKFTYTSNTGSGSITGYAVDHDGALHV